MPSIKLGELLIKANVLQEHQLRTALNEQKKWGGRLGEVLVRMTLVTEDLLVRALSKQLGLPVSNLDSHQNVPAPVLEKLPPEHAKTLQAVPLQLKDNGKTLIVAMVEPQNVEVLETLRTVTGCRILPQLTGRSNFLRAYNRFYGMNEELESSESSFQLLDGQGRPKGVPQLESGLSGAHPIPSPEVEAPVLAVSESLPLPDASALQAMVELLIEKGVFTREEYLAKVRR